LPRSGKPSREFFFDNSPVVLFVELRLYNTVVLGMRKRNTPVMVQFESPLFSAGVVPNSAHSG
jgi:hypothetical protein